MTTRNGRKSQTTNKAINKKVPIIKQMRPITIVIVLTKKPTTLMSTFTAKLLKKVGW